MRHAWAVAEIYAWSQSAPLMAMPESVPHRRPGCSPLLEFRAAVGKNVEIDVKV
jgi:hypothetical protein